MASVNNPTLRGRELGTRLRRLRTEADLTVEQVAERLECSAAKISRMETARRAVLLKDVRELCSIYGVDEEEQALLLGLVRDAKKRGWWHEYEDLGTGIAPLIGLQDAATFITDYETSNVPALLQTESYARAVLRGVLPLIEESVLEERVEARMLRQKLVQRDEAPPRLWCLLDEAALHRRVGGAAVMRKQLEHIVAMGDHPNITIQILPYSVGAHPGMDSTFVFIEFAEVPPVVFVEGLAGAIYLERESDMVRYRETIAQLRAMALSPAESLAFVTRVSREL
jgi:transcriptional regulator with XRE-family HTH domain